jgi:hypothetical protein
VASRTVSDPPSLGPLLAGAVVLVVVLLLLQAAAATANSKAVPPMQILRIVLSPVEPNLMAFTHSISRRLVKIT